MNNENKIIGNMGEKMAREYLEENGYIIIDTNFYCRFGEVDIVAKIDDEICFIEVKTRKQGIYGKPAESVTKYKKNHMYKVAEFYTYLHQLYDKKLSFGVIEVYLFFDKKPMIEHIKNAIIEKPRVTFLNRG